MQPTPSSQRSQHLGGGKKRKPFLIFDFALRRGPGLLLAGSLLTALFLLFLLPRVRPVYEADAMLLVDPTKEPTLTGRERDPIPGNFGDWTRTQISRITSEDVLLEAILRTPADSLPAFLRENPDHPANPFRLMKRIRIQELPRTYLIRLTIRNDDPEGIGEMLNTVMEVYLEKIEREFEQTYARRREYLQEERERISVRLRTEEQELLDLAQTLSNKAFLHEGYNVHLAKVEQLQRLYWEAFADATRTRAQLAKVQSDRKRISELSLQAFADARVADNFGINRIEQWTYEQLQQMRAQIDGLTPGNLDRVYVESRMEAMNNYLREYKQRVNDETILNLRQKQDFELETQELLARSAAEAGERRVEQLRVRLEAAQTEAGNISMAIFQASNPAFARSQLRDRLQAIDNRIDDTEMEAKAPMRVRIDKPAVSPSAPASSNLLTLVLIAAMAGFAPLGAALLVYELADTRIRTPKEMELALGGKGPDPITSFVSPVNSETHFHQATLNAPDHPASQRIRELATRIVHDHERFGSQLVVLAGLGRDCGVTSLGLNLAHALRALCGKVILVEICPEHPGLRDLTGQVDSRGIESCLRSETDLSSLILQDPDRNIDLMVSEGGGRPPHLHNLLPLLTDLKSNYDLVLIDAGAFPDDLCTYLARHAEALLLVARHKQTHYSELRRAIDLAIQSDVPAVAGILNASESRETPFLVSAIQETVITISTHMDKLLARVPLLRRGV